MTEQNVTHILPPPSVDDLLALGSESRVGQVDFAARLVPARAVAEAAAASAAPSPAPSVARVVAEELAEQDAAIATVTSVLPHRRGADTAPEDERDVEHEDEAEEADEPVAEVDDEPTVEVAPAKPRTRAKPVTKAPARKATPRKAAAARKPAAEKPAARKAALAPEPRTRRAAPPILPVASLAPVADLDEERPDRRRMPMEPAERPQSAPRPRAQAPITDDSSYLGASVQEVADAAIERLRDAENATLAHLVALEAEAVRRAELLTAQAELDAELIRITARREAHAIISEARSQAGIGGGPTSREGRQLAEISDAVSRFAESIESTLLPVHPYAGHGDDA